jgi:predicted MPP superfamily phosphohydrolase
VLAFLFSARHLIELAALCLVCLVQSAGAAVLWRAPAARRLQWARPAILAGAALSLAVAGIGFLFQFARVYTRFSNGPSSWTRGVAMLWAFLSVLLVTAYFVSRALAGMMPGAVRKYVRTDERGRPAGSVDSPARRVFLRTAQAALMGAPVAATAYGTFVQRFRLSVREADIAIPGLPHDLDGLRLVQLTDIHLSPFLSVHELERAVQMANETRAHIALVTGDLITSAADPLDDCLRRLSRLKAEAGIFGCMGNHEIYARAESRVEREGARLGMRFLRQRAELLKFGGAALNLAGVDYQHMRRPYLVGAERMVVPGAVNLLMSHNPDVFPVAVRKGFHFTISGHTHGGQVRVEILREDLNIARFFTPYVDGLYRSGGASIFVSRGIGTIGLPTRLGAPPEVALLRLCRS